MRLQEGGLRLGEHPGVADRLGLGLSVLHEGEQDADGGEHEQPGAEEDGDGSCR